MLIFDVNKDPAEESENPADGDQSIESATTTDPQVGEDHAEKGTSEEEAPEGEVSEEGEESARDDQADGQEAGHESILLEGEEEPDDGSASQPKDQKDNVAWTRMRKAEAAEKKARERIAELERKLQPSEDEAPGDKPTLESCGWDEEAKDKALLEWNDKIQRKAARDAQRAQQQAQAKAEADAKAAKLEEGYKASKAEWAPRVGAKPYEVAEKAVASALGVDAQDILMKVAKKPAMVVYALGTRPALLEEFAKETDRDMFVARLKDMEASIKVKKKGTPPPPPDRRITGSGGSAGGSTLEKLREDAAKSGDYSKVDAFKRKQREALEARERASRK